MHMRRAASIAIVAALLTATSPATAPSAWAIPPAPSGLQESFGTVAADPLLRWNAVAGATRYQVQIAQPATFGAAALDVITANTSLTPDSALTPGTHAWRVRAEDATGWGPWATDSFVRGSLSVATPIQLAPADGAVLDRLTEPPIAAWTSVAGAAEYELDLLLVEPGAEPFGSTVRTTAQSFSFLRPGMAVEWRVRALSRDGATSAWSPFRTVGMEMDTVVSGRWPADGWSGRDTVVGWDPEPGTRAYHMQFRPAGVVDWADPAVLQESTAASRFLFEDYLRVEATYDWRVRVIYGDGLYGPWSDAREISRTLSPAPSLLGPASGTSHDGVVPMSWSPVVRSAWYQIDVSADPTFATGVSRHETTETFHDLTTREEAAPHILVKGVTYHWRVRGLDSSTGGGLNRPGTPWSTTRTFVYEPGVSDLLSPADGATVEVPILTWDPSDAIGHRVTIEDVDGTVVDQAFTRGVSYTPDVMLDAADGPFTWYVERTALSGLPTDVTAWRSEERTFQVAPLVAGSSLELVGPTDIHTLHTPSLRWTPIQGAAYYHVVSHPSVTPFPNVLTPDETIVYPAFTFKMPPSSLELGQVWVMAFDADDTPFAVTGAANWYIDRLPVPEIIGPDCSTSSCPIFAEPQRVSWEPVPGAITYHVFVQSGAGLGTQGAVTTATSAVLPYDRSTSVGPTGPYQWQVRACTGTACGTEASAAYLEGGAPVALGEPLDGAVIAGPEVTFQWLDATSASTGPQLGSALSEPAYWQLDVWAEDSGGGDSSLDGVEHTDRLTAGTYQWRVYGHTSGIYGIPVSETRSFTVSWPGPSLASPADDAVVARTPALTWDAPPYAQEYEFQLFRGASVSGDPLIATSVLHPAVMPVDELAAGTYTWRVRAYDTGLTSSWSTARQFTISAPSAPTLIGPADGTRDTDGRVLFDWNDSAGAIAYRIEASATAAFSSIVWSAVTGQSAWAPTTLLMSPVYWRVVATGPSGTALATSATRYLLVDPTPPTVTAPRRGFTAGVGLTNGAILMRIPWSGTDAGSGIDRYELHQQTNGGAWATVSTTLTAPTSSRGLVTERTYRFRVRAVDKAGNVSAWAYGDTFRVSRFSEGNSRITYSGTWSTSSYPVFWGGAAKASSKAGSRASITFTGRSVAWVSSMGPIRGKAEVLVNGVKVATVDLYSATSKHQQVVWTGSWTTAASRTITIRVLGTSGRPRVDLDAFVTAN